MNEVAIFDAEKINAVQVFASKDSIDVVLKSIESEVMSHIPDLTTDKGRKHVASIAYKVSKSKTVIDDAGKQLVADEKKRLALVDESRKHARDFLDALRDRVRQPLTDWEAEQAAIAKAEQDAKDAAIKAEQDSLEAERVERERAAEAERAQLAADLAAANEKIAEAERLANAEKQKAIDAENARLAEIAQKEREEKIRADAEAAAKYEAEQTIIRAEQAAKKAAEDAEIEKQRAVKAERDRIEKERADAAAIIEAARIEAVKKAANENHRKSINNTILDKMTAIGISSDHAKLLISAIVKNEIDHISINY